MAAADASAGDAGAGSLDGDATTLAASLQLAVNTWPDRNLFGTKATDKYEWVTYREFAAGVDEVARALVAAGVKPGDRVGIIGKNSVDWAR